MKISIKRAAVLGLTGAVVATGGGIAIAQGTKDDPAAKERQAYLDSAAKRLDTTPDKVESALKGAWEDRLDAAVKAGRLTQQQADEIKQREQRGPGGYGIGPGPGFGPGPGGPGRGGPGAGPGAFGGPAVFEQGLGKAADYLGVSEDSLRKSLRGGKSLADVAKAQSKDVAGLKAVLKTFAQSKLDAAVKDKKLTQAQADRFAKELDEHLDDLISGDMPGPGFGHGPGHGPGPGGPAGPGGRGPKPPAAPSATPSATP